MRQNLSAAAQTFYGIWRRFPLSFANDDIQGKSAPQILKPVRIFSDTGFTCILLWICNKFSASERGLTAPFIYVSTVTGTGIAPGHNIEGALRGPAGGGRSLTNVYFHQFQRIFIHV